jgi:hypothetical protein
MIQGRPYNPHSLESVERLHQKFKKAIFSFYNENKDNFNLKETIITICDNYNSRKHSATQYTPKQIFFSHNKDLFIKVKNNLEKKYTNNFNNLPFELNEKVLLNPAFIKSKKYDSKKLFLFLNLKKLRIKKY